MAVVLVELPLRLFKWLLHPPGKFRVVTSVEAVPRAERLAERRDPVGRAPRRDALRFGLALADFLDLLPKLRHRSRRLLRVDRFHPSSRFLERRDRSCERAQRRSLLVAL